MRWILTRFSLARRTRGAPRVAASAAPALLARRTAVSVRPNAPSRPLRFLGPFGALAFVGCALTAPIPGGPLRTNTVTQLQPSWALAYGRASARLGDSQVRGNAQTFGGPFPWGAVVPIRLGVRQAVGSVVDVGGDLGWVDSGLELRAGSPEGSWVVPMAISAGIRSSYLTIPSSNSGSIGFALDQGTFERRLRVEAYPEVPMGRLGPVRLLLSAGVSWGAFAHDLVVGTSQEAGPNVTVGPVGVLVVRPEHRLELAIGIYRRGTRGTVAFAIAPWILLDAGAPTRAECVRCDPTGPVTDFSQAWGIALIVSPALVGDLIARLSGGP